MQFRKNENIFCENCYNQFPIKANIIQSLLHLSVLVECPYCYHLMKYIYGTYTEDTELSKRLLGHLKKYNDDSSYRKLINKLHLTMDKSRISFLFLEFFIIPLALTAQILLFKLGINRSYSTIIALLILVIYYILWDKWLKRHHSWYKAEIELIKYETGKVCI